MRFTWGYGAVAALTLAVSVGLLDVPSRVLGPTTGTPSPISLPQAVAYPDPDYLVLNLVATAGLCAAGFAAGWWVARRLRADRGQQTALMFGLGMTNNGTGLVLAATALADHPQVMLPILFYNLVQHLAAGAVNAARKPAD